MSEEDQKEKPAPEGEPAGPAPADKASAPADKASAPADKASAPANKPAAGADKPAPADKPAAEPEKPAASAAKPAAKAEKAAARADKPAPKGDKPAAKAEKAAAKTKAVPAGADKAKDGEKEKSPEAPEGAEGEEAKPERPASPSAADLLKEDIGEVKIRRAKGSKNIHSGVVHVLATFNNTKVTFADRQGNVISWSSAGKCNFRGSRKSTAYAAQVVTQDAGRRAMSHGLKEVEVHLKGPGMGRDSAVRALQALGLTVTSIRDVTPVPHNGCRPPKRRRV